MAAPAGYANFYVASENSQLSHIPMLLLPPLAENKVRKRTAQTARNGTYWEKLQRYRISTHNSGISISLESIKESPSQPEEMARGITGLQANPQSEKRARSRSPDVSVTKRSCLDEPGTVNPSNTAGNDSEEINVPALGNTPTQAAAPENLEVSPQTSENVLGTDAPILSSPTEPEAIPAHPASHSKSEPVPEHLGALLRAVVTDFSSQTKPELQSPVVLVMASPAKSTQYVSGSDLEELDLEINMKSPPRKRLIRRTRATTPRIRRGARRPPEVVGLEGGQILRDGERSS